MNTHKSNDFYAEYTGVAMGRLLKRAGMLDSATGMTVFAPDGWAQYHPLAEDPDPVLYHVFGVYPAASYYYDEQADIAHNAADGWMDYSSPRCEGRIDGDVIETEKPLRMLLAYQRDGENLTPGTLTSENKLDGEGPFRIVPPQKSPGPPDQKSTATNQDVVWPFNYDADHNAGFSTRSVTIIKVEPLPEGTTDIDTLEAGWDFVDEGKVIVYGAIDPVPAIKARLRELQATVSGLDRAVFRSPYLKGALRQNIRNVRLILGLGHYEAAMDILRDHMMPRFDGCNKTGNPDGNDWTEDCEIQNQLYWAMNEIVVLLQMK